MIKYFQTPLLAIGLFFCANLSASEPEDTLKVTVESTLDVMYSEEFQSLSVEEKQAKIRAAIEGNYDLNVIIRRTIGKNWDRLDVAQQEQVLELVKQLVLKAYVDGLDGLARPEVVFGKVVKVSDKRIEIDSRIIAGDKTFYVLYRLRRMDDGWQIYDIVAENISVVSNYRQQIDDHFRKGTGAELITRLEELLAQKKINDDIQI